MTPAAAAAASAASSSSTSTTITTEAAASDNEEGKQQVAWFWEALAGLAPTERAMVWRFATGKRYPPRDAAGFAAMDPLFTLVGSTASSSATSTSSSSRSNDRSTSSIRSSRSGSGGGVGGLRPNARELAVLSDLGIDSARWVEGSNGRATWGVGSNSSSSSDGTLFYGEEVFTFFLSGALPDEQLGLSSLAAGSIRGSGSVAVADDLVVKRQVELGLHQTWRVCKALREHHNRVAATAAAAAAEGTVVTYGNDFRWPLVVVACSSQNERKSQAPEKQWRRVLSNFDCDA
jgi:hypothetical protein